uniref:Uncharacterized protein n=1 Tax=Ananas comosus var. bracteatus TaxID=296719 RepID=A0A6V7QUD5_ANACO
MAKELAGDAGLWLPSELLEDDFFLDEKRRRVCGFGSHESSFASGLGSASDSPADSAAETESDEEDYLAGLTRRMTHSFLLDDDDEENTGLSTLAAQNPKVISGSPQSTLCGVGLMSAPGNESPNGTSQISPPTSPLEKSNDEPWDLLYKTTMENHETLQKQRTFYGFGALESATKPSPAPTSAPPKSFFPDPVLARRQLQAAQFYQLRQQQILKQQQQQYAASAAAWGRSHNSRVRSCGGGYGEERSSPPLGLSPSAWPPLQKPPPPPPAAPPPPPPPQGSGMRAIFLAGAGAKRESAGTGVFLPRRPGAPADPRKKPSCSTVLLPIRVIQALNLNPDELGTQPRYPGGFVLDHDVLIGRSNSMLPHQKRSNNYLRPQPPPLLQPMSFIFLRSGLINLFPASPFSLSLSTNPFNC